MLVARVEHGEIKETGDIRKMFPNISFPAAGPTKEFLREHSLTRVVKQISYDGDRECLKKTAPYFNDGAVYTCKTEPLTEQEIADVKSKKKLLIMRSELPSVEEQLDMLFEDMENGTTKWRDAKRAVKQKYQEPSRTMG